MLLLNKNNPTSVLTMTLSEASELEVTGYTLHLKHRAYQTDFELPLGADESEYAARHNQFTLALADYQGLPAGDFYYEVKGLTVSNTTFTAEKGLLSVIKEVEPEDEFLSIKPTITDDDYLVLKN